MRQKEKATQWEVERAEMIAETNDYIKNMPHPYAKELETCDHLISYLNTLKVRAGLIGDSEKAARETQQDLLSEMNKEKM